MARLDLIDLLRIAGIGSFNAPMSIPYMNMLPRTCEPSAQGVQQLVQGLQRLLNMNGPGGLKVDGELGPETLRQLIVFAGPRWFDRTWAELYTDVLAGKVHKDLGLGPFYAQMKPVPRSLVPMPTATGDVIGSVTDFATSPVGLVAIGAVVAWRLGWFKKLKRAL